MLMSYPETPKSSLTFFSFQRPLQTALIVFAVLCIPWMLLGKPIYIIMKNRKRNVNLFNYLKKKVFSF
jgi:V-type H+-transporting ATPase subunit a